MDIIKRIALNRVVQHILFWCLSFLILVNILKVSAEIARIDLIYTAIFHGPIALVTYLNLLVLVPYFLEKEKYFYYGLSLALFVSAGSGFYLILFEKWIDYLLEGYYFIAYYNFWDISLYFAVYLLLTTLVRLARSWFRLNRAEQEKTSSELKALRSQINPHFLFNSLNSIYSLSRKKSELAPQAVLKLSDILRYVIYDAEEDFILLKDEIEFLKKYVKLQQIRLDEGFEIDFKLTGDILDQKIAPLIFLPFVENAFKYAPQSLDGNKYINIDISLTLSEIIFKIVNSSGVKSISENEKYKGVGIQNVQKRLNIIYEGKHDLEIEEKGKEFKVDLKIQLN